MEENTEIKKSNFHSSQRIKHIYTGIQSKKVLQEGANVYDFGIMYTIYIIPFKLLVLQTEFYWEH